jgi:hypothetical protein
VVQLLQRSCGETSLIVCLAVANEIVAIQGGRDVLEGGCIGAMIGDRLAESERFILGVGFY